MPRHLPLLALLLALTACTRGPVIDDARYQPGQYNITAIQLESANAALTQTPHYRTAEQTLTPLLVQKLPRKPHLPAVTLVVAIERADEHTDTTTSYDRDKDGNESGSKDVTTTVTYWFRANLLLREADTGKQIAHSTITKYQTMSEKKRGSSLEENLFSGFFMDDHNELDPAAFYGDYADRVVRAFYPKP